MEGEAGKADCESKIDRALTKNVTVKFMIKKLEEAGCTLPRRFFQAEECNAEVAGGFVPGEGVIVCHNSISSQGDIDRALVHELVHAYDHCRAKVDWSNCKQHACSEVRAAILSGDCNLSQELLRGNFGLQGQFKKCAKRRAELSVKMNPACSDIEAKAAVDEMFEKCFQDTAPFDRIP